jgi:hypothetical protein
MKINVLNEKGYQVLSMCGFLGWASFTLITSRDILIAIIKCRALNIYLDNSIYRINLLATLPGESERI